MFLNMLMTMLLCSVAPQPDVDETLVLGNNDFAFSLYGELTSGSENLFFSPYSVSSALSMVSAGARGDTETEMRTVLHHTGVVDVHNAFKNLNENMLSNKEYELNIANGLCLTGAKVKRDYKKLLKKQYGAEIFSGDLGDINNWVSKKTKKRIPSILDQLDRDSACVVLNAIYFKANWEKQFKERSSFDQIFYISADEHVSVPMMHQTGRFKYYENDKVKLLKLPYEASASMIVVLPKTVDGLPDFETDLSSLNDMIIELNLMKYESVKLALPKFKMETNYDLQPSFVNLGMVTPFSSNADFSGISDKPMSIAKIKHKAFLQVDEKGSEAAAATSVELKLTSMPQDETVFIADHPFMFLIIEEETGSILFLGRLCNPEQNY